MDKNLSAPASHAHYMRPLDGIRGMACLLVVASHIVDVADVNGSYFHNFFGSFGVLIFFTLSGFLMSALYSHEAFSFDSVAKYSIARFSRIAPAYWIAVLFMVLVCALLPVPPYDMSAFNILRSVFFAGNQGVLWSIPPEVQFYVFFIGLWFSYARHRAVDKRWLGLMSVLCVALIATKDMWGGLMLPSKLHIFLGGFITALLIKNERIKTYLHSIYAQIGLSIVILCYMKFFMPIDGMYKDLFLPAMVALWIGSMSGSSLFTKPFETLTMRTMGAASFSIYLFHECFLKIIEGTGLLFKGMPLANAALLCVVALVPPVAFHYMVEKKLNIWSKKKLLDRLAVFEMRGSKAKL